MASSDEKDNLVELDEEIVESKAPGKPKSNLISIIIIILLVLMIVAAVVYYFVVIARQPASLPAVTDTTIVDLSDSLNIIDTTSYTDSLALDTTASIAVLDTVPQDALVRDSVQSDSVSTDTTLLPPPEIMDTIPVPPAETPAKKSAIIRKKSKSNRSRRIPKSKVTPSPAQPAPSAPSIPKESIPVLSVETTRIVPQPSQLIRSVIINIPNGIVITDRVRFDRDRVRYMAFSAQGMKSLPLDRIQRIDFMYDGPISFSDQSGLYLVSANIITRNGEIYKNVVIPELSFHTSQEQHYLIKDRFIRTRSINSVNRITLLE